MYYHYCNEQSMVHTAAAYTKVKNRLKTFACTTSIGPGSTNMITGGRVSRLNRIPILLLPGDYFSRRNTTLILQELKHTLSQ
ncbi:MAG: thiamine pyrophosphate-binding protein [Flavobacteriales bacterium AspAUS03]